MRQGNVWPNATLLLVAVGLFGCSEKPEEKVVVFGAASTTNALNEIKQRFAEEHGVEVQVSYASSSTLAQQIFNGAEADVFISADVRWADYLDEKGMVERRRELLGNRLVIVVPADSTIDVRGPADLLAAEIEHVALGDPDAVPAGVYAKEALSKLGLWEQVKDKVVAGADVRQALIYVETRAAEAGIVYGSDAAITDKVKVAVEIPAELTRPIRYPAMLLKHGAENPAAAAFYEYLSSPAAAAIFKKHGFAVDDDVPEKRVGPGLL